MVSKLFPKVWWGNGDSVTVWSGAEEVLDCFFADQEESVLVSRANGQLSLCPVSTAPGAVHGAVQLVPDLGNFISFARVPVSSFTFVKVRCRFPLNGPDASPCRLKFQ